jgi:tetraacyldisaccharide 4'-kinase
LIEDNNLKIEKKIIYPDHHPFSASEIQNFINKAEKNNYQIIMTEKDYFKISHFGFKEINFLKVALIIENIDKLINELNKV